MSLRTHFRRRSQVVFFILGLCLLFLGAFLLWASALRMPDLESIKERKVTQSTKIYDRTGKILLFALHEDANRTVVPLENISPLARAASVAIEDSDFYAHSGIRPLSILRAVLVNLTSLGYSQGGSTITQQVVKNALLTQDKSLARKLKEWVLSVRLERLLSKDRILEIYLNESPYGGSIYGIEEASSEFFGKHASELSAAEAAYLAALPQAPTYFSPYGNHRGELEARKNLVLEKMYEYKYLTKEEYEKALAEKVSFLPATDGSIKAPHFVFFVREYLANKYGEEALSEGGLRVVTSLDYALQQKAEEVVKKYALENKKNFNAENAALVAIDPKSGEVLAMVGSRDYFDQEIDGNYNVALALRQPGSAFKPFVYASAFKKGYTPETVLFDVETEFSSGCTPEGVPLSPTEECYKPVNYDSIYRGPVTLRDSLAQSLNVPSVKTLYLSGLKESLRTARDVGITTLTSPERYGLTLVLGGGEVTLLELTSAYGVFANEGLRLEPVAVLQVEDNKGNGLEKHTPSPREVLDKNVARTISDILSDNDARSPAFGDRSYLYFSGRSVAAKTGTTNDYRDAWIVGYTSKLAVGAWAGNNDNSPMEKKVAGFIVAPLWHAFMVEALRGVPEEKFSPPAPTPEDTKPILRGVWRGGITYIADTLTGQPAGSSTPENRKEERVVQSVHSILYWLNKNNPLGPTPTEEERAKESQFNSWEYGVRKWATEHHLNDAGSPP